MTVVKILLAVVSLLLLIFVGWITGGSLVALVVGILLLMIAAVFGAQAAGIMSIPASAQSMLSLAGMLCVIIIVWAGFKAHKDNEPPSSSNSTAARSSTARRAPAPKKLYRERVAECYTPCAVNLDFKFELDTQGDPIDLKFPGIRELVHYSGKGTISVPDSRDVGDVIITSPDPTKTVWVKVDKLVWK